MKIIDHGEWESYTPTRQIMDASPECLFSKCKKDDKDWYEYLASKPFKPDSVKLTCRIQLINIELEKGWVVAACSRDETMIFPIDAIMLELDDFASKDLRKDLESRIYDPKTKKFSDKRAFE